MIQYYEEKALIGENIKSIPNNLKKRHKEIKWKKFEGTIIDLKINFNNKMNKKSL